MADWPLKTIGDLVTLQRGIDLPTPKRVHGPVPIMGSFGITGFHNKAARQGPGVTVGRSGGSIGTVCYVEGDYWPLNTCLYVKDFHGNNPRFAYYYLQTVDLAGMNSGSAQPSLNRNFVHPFPAAFPAPAEQKTIAKLLGSIDDKIELNRQMNKTLEASARALFRDWFVDFGPTKAKMAGAAPYLAPDLWALFPDKLDHDLVPGGWLSGELSDLIEFNPREKLPKGINAPYIDMASLPVIGSTIDTPIDREFKSGSKFRVNDALMARITPCLENGKTGYVDSLAEDVVGWGSTEFFVLRSRRPVPPAFAYLVAREPNFRATAMQSMSGTSGRQRASKDALETYPFAKPNSNKVWDAFGKIIDPLFSRIKANGEENRTLTQTRDLLLPKLMSGEIRIRDAEQTVSELA